MQNIEVSNNTPPKKVYYSINKQTAKMLFAMYTIAWNNDCRQPGNRPRPLGTQIRTVHQDYYAKLLDLLAQQLYDRQIAGQLRQPDEYLKLSTNSVSLAAYVGIDERTIRNYNSRLIKCGILEKTNHGHQYNYELVFNNWLVSAVTNTTAGVSNGKYEFFRNWNDLPDKAGRKTLPAIISYLQIHYNNKLINVEHKNQEAQEATIHRLVTPSDFSALLSSYRCTEHIIYQYQGNTAENAPVGNVSKEVLTARKIENKPENKPADEQKSNLRKFSSSDINVLRLAYAGSIYSYAIDNIPGWTESVYDSVHNRVPFYIAQNYLANITTKADLDRFFTTLARPAIDAAAELVKKKIASQKWLRYNVMPDTWFNKKYAKGFVASYLFVKENNKKIQNKVDELNRLDDLDKLNRILVDYYTSNTDNYYNLLDRVRATIPHRERQFKFCIKNNLKQAQKYWIVGDRGEVIVDESKAS